MASIYTYIFMFRPLRTHQCSSEKDFETELCSNSKLCRTCFMIVPKCIYVKNKPMLNKITFRTIEAQIVRKKLITTSLGSNLLVLIFKKACKRGTDDLQHRSYMNSVVSKNNFRNWNPHLAGESLTQTKPKQDKKRLFLFVIDYNPRLPSIGRLIHKLNINIYP